MCGIAGVIEIGPERCGREVTEAIVRSQLRRGPDAQAVISLPGARLSATLGHSRLSIIDLSAASHQPMWDADRRRCIVYNGEIYNYLELRAELSILGHRFSTQGDTEVVLAAFSQWGIEAVGRFLGMFAMALWDSQEGELWLIRDRFGVKPLYYGQTGTAFFFGSTPTVIAGVLRLPPDLGYVRDGIDTFVYERDDARCQYTGLCALPAAHRLRLSLGNGGDWRLSMDRYYDLEARVAELREPLASESVPRLTMRVREILESAVELRLRSDVPVGISLSGGVDSSSIAAIVAVRHADVTAFSYGDPGDAFSEGKSVQSVVKRTGIKVVYCAARAETLHRALWETLEAQGAPFAGGSIVAQNLVFRAARERGVIVLLGGQGGDEALMGYHKFKVFLLQEALRRSGSMRSLALLFALAGALLAHAGDLVAYWRQRRRFLSGAGRSDLLAPSGAPVLQLGLPAGSPAWKRQLLDVTRYSLPTLLRYEDRNSMGNSIESRLPFLDHRMVELGLALPEAVKVRRGLGKWVLREAMRGAVPSAILDARRKMGFNVEIRRWVREGMGGVIRTRLEESRSGYAPYLRRPIQVAERFSDARLCQDPFSFPEAMSLAWLAQIPGA